MSVFGDATSIRLNGNSATKAFLNNNQIWPITSVVVSENLLLHYNTFNTSSYNGSGVTITDISGNSRNGTITGSPTWTSNYFTFVDDYITTPNLSSIITSANEVHSVELWIYPTDNGVLVQYNNSTSPNTGYHASSIEIVGGNLEVGLWGGSSPVVSTGNIGTVSFNQWHQIVLTYNGSVCKGYIDGVYKGSVNVSWDSPMNQSFPFYMNFGYRDTTSQGDGTDFNGRFGIMRVYNVALTDAQILSNYNSTLTTIPNIITDGLVLRLDATNTNSYNGSGTTWFDIRGDYDFTLTNSPTFNSEGYFDFNGTNQYAITAHNSALKPTSELTIEQWLWADDWTAGDSVNYKTSLSCTQGGGYAHYIWDGTWRSYVRVGASYQIPTFDVSGLTGWHHFVTTFDGRYTKLYVDGVLVDTEDLGTSGNVIGYDADNSIVIGTEAGNAPGAIEAKYWDGKISTTLLYNRALTQMEVLQNYNSTVSVIGGLVLFTSVGTTSWTAPVGVTEVEYLVVAGAGGGGNGYDNAGGAGGGAGMVLTGSLSVTPGESYTVTVGDGGNGGADTRTNNAGSSGENSVFATITALGGGFGAGSRTGGSVGLKQVGSTTAPTGGTGSGGGQAGKGGGGATGDGTSNSGSTPGTGGAGLTSTISGTSVTYGVGGNGGSNLSPTTNGTNGTTNRGNGGNGGRSVSSDSASGGKGGSGIVIIKY